jgi:hypothetical protein
MGMLRPSCERGWHMSEHSSPWELLRRGAGSAAMRLIREAYPETPTASEIMRLGIAHLWLRDYKAAVEHFQHAIRTHRSTIDKFYGMAGVSWWCTNWASSGAAVRVWNSGLNAQYNDGAGGVHLPLLMFVASILRYRVFPRSEAEQLLRERINDPRVKNWPGPLAKLVLDNENMLPALYTGVHERDTKQRKWITRFYRTVLDYGTESIRWPDFQQIMREMSDTTLPEWADEKDFTSLIWNEEFFIARNEAFLETLGSPMPLPKK